MGIDLALREIDYAFKHRPKQIAAAARLAKMPFPANCIQMKNVIGKFFLYPEIDASRCIGAAHASGLSALCNPRPDKGTMPPSTSTLLEHGPGQEAPTAPPAAS
jgi:hypothetical protein